jgi:hypothetical protein
MWSCANSIPVIEEALGIQFRHHQKKYGRVIVPDSQLAELLESIQLLPDKYDGSIDLEFVTKINSDGWRTVSSIFSKQEALLVAIMSLAAENFAPIRNRHKWSNPKEARQNRCVGQLHFHLFFYFCF